MKLKEIAQRITAYLRRFEADPTINIRDGKDGPSRYYQAYACVAGPYIGLMYISYQGSRFITKAEAERYLQWLDAGNVGKYNPEKIAEGSGGCA